MKLQTPTSLIKSAFFLFQFVGTMMFNPTFNNISVISWWSILWWRKPQICCTSLTNFITSCCIEYTSPWWD